MRRYEIRVEGVLDERWSSWFGGLVITTEGSVTVRDRVRKRTLTVREGRRYLAKPRR